METPIVLATASSHPPIYKVIPYLSFFGFYTHQINTDFYNQVRQGMNFGFTLDFKSVLTKNVHLL